MLAVLAIHAAIGARASFVTPTVKQPGACHADLGIGLGARPVGPARPLSRAIGILLAERSRRVSRPRLGFGAGMAGVRDAGSCVAA